MKTDSRNSNSDTVMAVPEGYHTVTPYLIVSNAQGLIDYLVKAFNAEEQSAMKGDNGSIIHASIKIGDSIIMVSDLMKDTKPTNSMLYLYVEDVDSLFKQASKVKGAKVTRELKDEFYGDRSACFTDDWGNHWWIASHVENVEENDLEKRMAKASK